VFTGAALPSHTVWVLLARPAEPPRLPDIQQRKSNTKLSVEADMTQR